MPVVKSLMVHCRTLILALTALAMLTVFTATGGNAQQPTSVNPTASSVQEQQLLEALKTSKDATPAISGRISIPDQRERNLIRPAGQDYRQTHEVTLPIVGAVSILGMLLLTMIFFVTRGRIRVSSGFSGRTILRFGGFSRFNHWMTATAFILLAFSGLNLTFGKSLLLPFVGEAMFSNITQMGKFVHNYVSFAFALGIALMFLIWFKDNIPMPRDVVWLAKGGGMVGKSHPPAGKFNAGQKLLFWVVVAGGAGLAFTGYNLMFPFQFTDTAGMVNMNVLHALIGLVMVAIIIGHIYIGTLGMQGAFSAMGSGKVDVNWAREHHSIWADKVAGKAGSPAPGQRPQAAE